MSLLQGLRSQWNNVKFFRSLFPLRSLARGAVSLPVDYLSPTGRAAAPMVLNLLLTSRCNLKCNMCSASEFRGRRYPEMSAGDVERLARSVAAFRPTFYFGGGEPFVRDDILDLIEAVKRHDLRLGMVTNGMLFTPDRGRRAKELGLDHVLISLHGPEPIHDAITGTPGAFRRVTENIAEFCRAPRRTTVILNFVLSRDNLDHLFELIELGRRLGVDRVRIEHLLFMTGEEQRTHAEWCAAHLPETLAEASHASTLICQMAAVAGFREDLPRLLEEVRRRYGSFVFIKPALSSREVHAWYSAGYRSTRRCLFVWRALFVDPEGFVIPCQHYAGLKFGHALREPLLEVWNSPRYREFRREIRRGLWPACARCCKL